MGDSRKLWRMPFTFCGRALRLARLCHYAKPFALGVPTAGALDTCSSTEQALAHPRERIIHSIDRFTASQCNIILGKAGAFWQREPYDHWVRSPEELERILLYIEGNPVKAGLVKEPEEWRFSSARDRKKFGLELGQPLVRPAN
jgi:hypothetical protein